ncbi:TIGR03668 family PPOX class F420-dependent oxidoreductase [Streptomyces gobiensis]|uniref:TIGR03668 family PPOX class F420-dependent oxidoreductase n=1 Tax=Streptomyces gobiensis TaxID=2875706 RepID=UPI001E639A6F|nr:TIGR03668 family PPOX class F420-dependent oxidoreductase [Streptomyces gobiensis]UGY93244.1 TIGR03668 family PPOX class F420-dependent oxidoreductase [Streptomyces gobiensis]
MRLPEAEARKRLERMRVLRLATVDQEGRPHQVPILFAVRGDVVVTAIDDKPKRHLHLRRLSNIRTNSAVCVLADLYSDDWSELWWVRADGTAQILQGSARTEPVRLLTEKYPQYAERPPEGPVIEIAVTRWSGWAATSPTH